MRVFEYQFNWILKKTQMYQETKRTKKLAQKPSLHWDQESFLKNMERTTDKPAYNLRKRSKNTKKCENIDSEREDDGK